MKGIFQARKILKKEKPDVIFSKGGFVSVPVVIAASRRKIPVIAHESDITPGLANKLASPFCDKLCVTFRESLKYVKDNKGILTGSPIREEIFSGSKAKGLEICQFKNQKEVILIMGGSLGSQVINNVIYENLETLTNKFNIIHICGKGNVNSKYEQYEGYKQFEFVDKELPDLFAVADYIISRAGANSIFEFLALKKPMLLIPLSKKASRGDQILNANSFKKEGYALVMEEEEITTESFRQKVEELVNKKQELVNNMNKSGSKTGNSAVLEIIMSVVEKNKE